MYEFTFLRHGESVGNAEGYYQGQHDYPLSETGRRQVKVLAKYWKNKQAGFDKMISSPLLRASQSAEIIKDALDLPLELDPILMERDIGGLAGLSHDKAAARYPNLDFRSFFLPIGETGESNWQLFLRACEALEGLLARPPGNYLLVSHGGLLGKLTAAILGVPLSNPSPNSGIRFANAAYSRFWYDPENNRWGATAINQTAPDAISYKREGDHRFVFLRHAESEGNLKDIFQGQDEYPLSKTGRTQAENLAARWRHADPKFSKIITSPQQRTRETAQIIGEALNLAVESNPLLKEVDNGEWAGLTFQQIEETYPKANQFPNPFVPLGGSGESRWQFFIRGGRAVQELLTLPPGNYLIVSHGGTISRMITALLGISPQIYKGFPVLRPPNCGFATLDYNPMDGAVTLHQFGDKHHLDE